MQERFKKIQILWKLPLATLLISLDSETADVESAVTVTPCVPPPPPTFIWQLLCCEPLAAREFIVAVQEPPPAPGDTLTCTVNCPAAPFPLLETVKVKVVRPGGAGVGE